MGPGAKDEAGPLWIMLENFLEALPFWARWAVLAGGAGFALAAFALIVVLLNRKQ
jgi:hypothetical protein